MNYKIWHVCIVSVLLAMAVGTGLVLGIMIGAHHSQSDLEAEYENGWQDGYEKGWLDGYIVFQSPFERTFNTISFDSALLEDSSFYRIWQKGEQLNVALSLLIKQFQEPFDPTDKMPAVEYLHTPDRDSLIKTMHRYDTYVWHNRWRPLLQRQGMDTIKYLSEPYGPVKPPALDPDTLDEVEQ